MLTIQFKEITNHDIGINCIDPGRRQKAREQINTYQVPYSDYEPTEHTGKYLPYIRPMVFAWKDKTKTSAIYKWLTGYGKLRTSKDPGGYFKAHVISGYEVDRISKNYDRMMVQLKINPPFFYLDSGDVPIVMTAPGTINNPGTHTSDPYIRIVGSGNITVTINGRKMTFTNVETFIDIDTEVLPPIYKNNQNQGHKMVGDLPYFDVGANAITWTGAVTELNILPRWREL